MKLNQMRDMVAVVERGSLRAAARHLNLAQPALTRSIGALERELGVTLFERQARGMVLTSAGKLFHRRASAVVNEVRRAHEDFEQTGGDMRGSITVGLSIMPHMGMLPQALPVYRRRYPLVRLKIIEGLYPAMEAGLQDGSIDFYLGASPKGEPADGLVAQTLLHNTRTVIGRKGHPMAGAKSIKDLAKIEWATTTLDFNAEMDLNELFAKYKMPPPVITLQTHSALSVMVALSSCDLLAILPAQWNEFSLTRNVLQVINIKEKLPAPDIVMIRRPDLPLTPAADHFCDLLKRYVPA
ncbi:LysR substrate-binding domain-containing protein [Polaromonas sp.]|uniref:LysR substrate-binding domain-containing protein n=1 Tax=Polaromonas sp. TaxID=1869339 RepID=UPI00286CC57E|nr:LysR substrate-binding domain-containing protein [Polaromonas sp.]